MEIVKEFGINPILLLAQIVNFTILLLLLKKFLYKPVLKVLEERKQKIAKSLKDAQEIEKRLEQSSLEQQKLLDQARSEASELIKDAKSEAKNLAEKTLVDTKTEVEAMLKRNAQRLNLEREQMMKEVKKDLAEIVMAAAVKVSKKTMNKESNRKIVDETIKELSEKN